MWGWRPVAGLVLSYTFSSASLSLAPVREDQKPRIVSSLRNLCYHLQKQQLLQHTLLTTPDEK